MNRKPSPDILITRNKFDTKVSISKRKPRQSTNHYLSETISSQNKKQFKYVKPDTTLTQSQTKMFRTKITTFHLELPEKSTSVSKSFYEWGKAITETYDPYGHFTTTTDFGNDPYNHFS
jgi:hypothetical protein